MIVEKRQFFIILEEEGPEELKNLCREYTLPLDQEASRARGWILKHTKIGPVLDVKVCLHQNRYGIEIMVESLFRDGTPRPQEETTPTGNVERRSSGKLVAKARPQLKPAVTLSPISIPLCERKWKDINPERFHQDCFSTFDEIMKDHERVQG